MSTQAPDDVPETSLTHLPIAEAGMSTDNSIRPDISAAQRAEADMPDQVSSAVETVMQVIPADVAEQAGRVAGEIERFTSAVSQLASPSAQSVLVSAASVTSGVSVPNLRLLSPTVHLDDLRGSYSDGQALPDLIKQAAEPHAVGVLPEAEFSLDVPGATGWRIERFEATEALSDLYEVCLHISHDNPSADPNGMLGQQGTFKIQRGTRFRVFAGVVRRLEHRGVVSGHLLAKIFLVPELWGLSQRVNTRVFQHLNAIDVVQRVLSGAGVYSGRVRERLIDTRLPREYCVQHQESDLTFIRRLLEEEGVTFHFEHGNAGESLVLTDHATAWQEQGASIEGPIPIAGSGAGLLHRESIRHFHHAEELRPTSVTVRDHDFTRPRHDIVHSSGHAADDSRPVYTHTNVVVMSGYGSEQYQRDNRAEQARTRDQLHAAERQRATGLGNVTGFAPGTVFALEGHGTRARNARHLVIKVAHRGRAPEEDLTAHRADDSDDRYHNEFETMPADIIHRPARETQKPRIQGYLTATVVGPPGEEIYVDEHGRIKVQFHWDREGNRDANSSCWVRVMQASAGAGWGFVFTPRIGMEVVVQFADGDPDRPLVTGCVYNGENRPPYTLPAEKTKSTLRTRSSPQSEGFNELRFEDLTGHEQVFLHAQRNHDVVVRNNQSISVGSNRTKGVKGCEFNNIGRDCSTTVIGSNELKIRQGHTIEVRGLAGMSTNVNHVCSITSKQSIRLAVGGNSITITNKGIWINGTVVHINGGGEPKE